MSNLNLITDTQRKIWAREREQAQRAAELRVIAKMDALREKRGKEDWAPGPAHWEGPRR